MFVTFLPHPYDGVRQRSTDDHQHADPPQCPLCLVVVDDGNDGLCDGFRVGRDMMRHWRRNVDLHGTDPCHETTQHASHQQEHPEERVEQLRSGYRRRQLTGEDDHGNESHRRDYVCCQCQLQLHIISKQQVSVARMADALSPRRQQ